jgi:hypothetical protein
MVRMKVRTTHLLPAAAIPEDKKNGRKRRKLCDACGPPFGQSPPYLPASGYIPDLNKTLTHDSEPWRG